MASAEGIDDLLARIGAERVNLHPERLTKTNEPVEELWRLQRLDNRRHLHIDHSRQPERSPFPGPEMGKCKDRSGFPGAAVLLDRGDTVVGKSSVEFIDPNIGQPEALDVVPAVPLECLGDLSTLLGRPKRATVDPFQVASDNHTRITRHHPSAEAAHSSDRRCYPVRHVSGEERPRLVRADASHQVNSSGRPEC